MENLSKFGQNYVEKSNLFYILTFIRLSFEIFISLIVYCFQLIFDIFTIKPIKTISGQTALVTGGGNGLGKAICIELAKNGCHVVVVDIDIKAAEQIANELQRDFNIKSKAYQLDVSKFDDVNEIGGQIQLEMGPIDILVNNAGVIPGASILDVDPLEVDKVLGVNLKSHFWTTQKFLPEMRKRNQGHIVAICSLAGIGPVARGILYASSKFGVKGFMDSLNSELLLDNLNIKTTTVFPFFIATNDNLMDYLNSMNSFSQFPPLTTEFVARKTVEGIINNQEYIILPNYFAKLLFILQFIPKSIWLPKMYAGIEYKRRQVL